MTVSARSYTTDSCDQIPGCLAFTDYYELCKPSTAETDTKQQQPKKVVPPSEQEPVPELEAGLAEMEQLLKDLGLRSMDAVLAVEGKVSEMERQNEDAARKSTDAKAREARESEQLEIERRKLDAALAAQRRQKEAVRKQLEQERRNQGSIAKGGGRRYSAAQCTQLAAQVQELRRVLPQYDAYGQGGAIRQGINANTAEYNRGCR